MRLFYLIIIVIFLSAIEIQIHTLLNWDVSYLMHASEKLIQGGHYTQDFFETNPPMILFLYIPPVLLAKCCGISFVASVRFYVFILAFFSWMLCYVLGQKIFEKDFEKSILLTILILLCITFLLVPGYEFGQREHLLIILIFPYLLASVLYLSNQTLPVGMAILIGLLAGVGFAIKPFFLIPLCCIELTIIFFTRKFLSCIRIESIIILMVMICYLASIFWITPEYINKVVPFLFHLYYAGFKTQWIDLVFRDVFLFNLLTIFFFLLTLRLKPYWELRIILFIASLGFSVSYILESTLWFYHILPLYALSMVLSGLLCAVKFPLKLTFTVNNMAFLSYWAIFFWFPVVLIIRLNSLGINESVNSPRHDLITVMQKMPQYRSFYFISTNGRAFSLVDYAGKVSTSRFPSFWWLPGIINLSKLPLSSQETANLNKEKNYFFEIMTEDIKTKKPDLLIVDDWKYNSELKGYNINYLNYFSQNSQLKLLLQSYHFLLGIDGFDIYCCFN